MMLAVMQMSDYAVAAERASRAGCEKTHIPVFDLVR
jgi:hypothetical protein